MVCWADCTFFRRYRPRLLAESAADVNVALTSPNAWAYDTRGRVTSETVNAGTAYTTQWTSYNSADLPLTMQYPDGENVNYTYNSRMLLDSVIGTSTYVASTTYDSAGRINLRMFGNTTQTDYDYYP